MQARFLLGPAGSGKTFRCLAKIRTALLAAPDGPPLILLAPKQATFQLERQLLGWEEVNREAPPEAGKATPVTPPQSLSGYTRLRIFSFERLAQFILDQLHIAPPATLSEEGRVMVLRALLLQKQSALQVFRASARLTGFAQQLSLLLRELQRHRISPGRLLELASRPDNRPPLDAKLRDLALLLGAYRDWLATHGLQDANHLLDVATDALRTRDAAGVEPSQASHNQPALAPQLRIAALWLDGFAEMTPQELDLLAALMPFCDAATLAFCLECAPETEPSWLSPWTVVAQTFRRCHARLTNLAGCNVSVEILSNASQSGRFSESPALQQLEASWSAPLNPAAPALEPSQTPSAIRLVVCPNPEAEAVLAAREIWRHVRAGGRFRDCGIIVRRLEQYHAAIARVFRRYEIPFFMDRREAVAHHPLAELTRFAFRTIVFGWRHDDWFGALKTGLVSPDEDAIDELENEALARGWEGKVWSGPLAIANDSGRAGRLEALRSQIVPPFLGFAAALAENSLAPNGVQVAAALRELWDGLNVAETLARWREAAPAQGSIHPAVLEQMHDWLDNLERAFATEPLPLRDWLPILEAGLASLSVGVVPAALDQVLIGAIDRSRNPELRLAIVLGLNEGVFPAPPAPATLLTDTERSELEPQGVYLGPTRYQRLGHERYLGYIAVTRARQRLVLTCAAQDATGQSLNPSPLLDHVQRISGVTRETFALTTAWWESEHLCELEAPALQMPNLEVLGPLPPLVPVLEKWRRLQIASDPVPLPPAVVEKLFGSELKSSVSALEDFAACRFKFFAARGLRLQERKEFQFDDRDKGSFQHDALEEFHRRVVASGRRWRDLTPAEAGQLVETIGRELLPQFGGGKFQAGGAARFAGEYLITRLRRLLTALVGWMAQYDFDPIRCEIAFADEPDGLPSWRLDLGAGRALRLRGRIDRVDLFRQSDDTALAVVMDYKSSARKLDPTRLHHGLELQLLSYLGVLKHLVGTEAVFGVKRLVPAGVFYIPLNGGSGRPGATRRQMLNPTPAETLAAYQHSGRFLADELLHFDRRGVPKGDQFKYAKLKNGDFAKRGNEALPAAEFNALQLKIEGHLREYGRQIFGGEASVSPFRIGPTTACDYCEFRPVCRFDPWTQQYRDLRPPSRTGMDAGMHPTLKPSP